MAALKAFFIVVAILIGGLACILAYSIGAKYADPGPSDPIGNWFAGLFHLLVAATLGFVLPLASTLAIYLFYNRKAFPGAAIPFIVILPLPICVLVGFFISLNQKQNALARSEEKQARKEELLQQIRVDPEIVFRENWDETSEKSAALRASVYDVEIAYSDEQLKRIYEEYLTRDGLFFSRRALSTDFLVYYFKQFYGDDKKASRMVDIMQHPNLPIELVKQLAEDASYPQKYTSRMAKRIYKKRLKEE